MVQAVNFRVPCVPVAQPRQRYRVVTTGNQAYTRNYTPVKHPVNAYKAAVQLSWKQSGAGLFSGPVAVTLEFVFPRPQAMCWKRRATPRAWLAGGKDLDNLAKSTCDALTGLAWSNDSHVAKLVCSKFVAAGGETAGVEVTVQQLSASC